MCVCVCVCVCYLLKREPDDWSVFHHTAVHGTRVRVCMCMCVYRKLVRDKQGLTLGMLSIPGNLGPVIVFNRVPTR